MPPSLLPAGGPPPVPVPNPSGPPAPPYPVNLQIGYPNELNRWLPLVKWLLAIPHYIALFFLAIGAWFAVKSMDVMLPGSAPEIHGVPVS